MLSSKAISPEHSHGSDAVGQMMAKYDTDKSGSFSTEEVRQVVNDVMGAKESNAMLKKFSGALFFIVLLLTGALFGVSLAAGEALKENHIKGGTMTDLTGQAVKVDEIESTTTLWDIPALGTNDLAKMKDIVFIADLTNLAEVGSWVEMTMKISGVYKADANKAFLRTNSGETLTIDRAAKSGTVKIDGTAYPITDTLPAGRRLNTVPSQPPVLSGPRRQLLGTQFVSASGSLRLNPDFLANFVRTPRS